MEENDIGLCDIVVNEPTEAHGDIIQYDLKKVRLDGTFERKGTLNKPPLALLNAIQNS